MDATKPESHHLRAGNQSRYLPGIERGCKMIPVYFRFESLPDELRTAHKIKSKARLDCTGFTDNLPGGYKGLMNFVNAKGMMFFYLTEARDFVSADSKRIADFSLTNASINLTSIYIEDLQYPQYGYGTPNAKRFLSNGKENPLFDYRLDGYLFVMNQAYSQIEMFVIPGGRNLINAYYQKLIDGGLDEDIQSLRKAAKPFFDYGTAL